MAGVIGGRWHGDSGDKLCFGSPLVETDKTYHRSVNKVYKVPLIANPTATAGLSAVTYLVC